MGKKCFGASEKVDKLFLYSSLHDIKYLRFSPLAITEGKDWPRPFLLIMCVTIKALGIAFAFHQR
jgi:hypothetical protein